MGRRRHGRPLGEGGCEGAEREKGEERKWGKATGNYEEIKREGKRKEERGEYEEGRQRCEGLRPWRRRSWHV